MRGSNRFSGRSVWSSPWIWYMVITCIAEFCAFLLSHVLCPARQVTAASLSETVREGREWQLKSVITASASGSHMQAASLSACFSGSFRRCLTPAAILSSISPIIWMGMRRGDPGAVTGCLPLNFVIVVTPPVVPVSAEAFTKLWLLMLSISRHRIDRGAAVSERER